MRAGGEGDAGVEGMNSDGRKRGTERATEQGEVLLCVVLVDDRRFLEALTSRGELLPQSCDCRLVRVSFGSCGVLGGKEDTMLCFHLHEMS